MWRLNIKAQKLECFMGSLVSKYAILSHTWGDYEVTLQDLEAFHWTRSRSPEVVDDEVRKDFKVEKSCEVAQANGYDYIWIDMCYRR
jgi:hypothetical protein